MTKDRLTRSSRLPPAGAAGAAIAHCGGALTGKRRPTLYPPLPPRPLPSLAPKTGGLISGRQGERRLRPAAPIRVGVDKAARLGRRYRARQGGRHFSRPPASGAWGAAHVRAVGEGGCMSLVLVFCRACCDGGYAIWKRFPNFRVHRLS